MYFHVLFLCQYGQWGSLSSLPDLTHSSLERTPLTAWYLGSQGTLEFPPLTDKSLTPPGSEPSATQGLGGGFSKCVLTCGCVAQGASVWPPMA